MSDKKIYVSDNFSLSFRIFYEKYFSRKESFIKSSSIHGKVEKKPIKNTT